MTQLSLPGYLPLWGGVTIIAALGEIAPAPDSVTYGPHPGFPGSLLGPQKNDTSVSVFTSCEKLAGPILQVGMYWGGGNFHWNPP